eukprot:359430-Chlamydomonas_euryale.AAC.6
MQRLCTPVVWAGNVRWFLRRKPEGESGESRRADRHSLLHAGRRVPLPPGKRGRGRKEPGLQMRRWTCWPARAPCVQCSEERQGLQTHPPTCWPAHAPDQEPAEAATNTGHGWASHRLRATPSHCCEHGAGKRVEEGGVRESGKRGAGSVGGAPRVSCGQGDMREAREGEVGEARRGEEGRWRAGTKGVVNHGGRRAEGKGVRGGGRTHERNCDRPHGMRLATIRAGSFKRHRSEPLHSLHAARTARCRHAHMYVVVGGEGSEGVPDWPTPPPSPRFGPGPVDGTHCNDCDLQGRELKVMAPGDACVTVPVSLLGEGSGSCSKPNVSVWHGLVREQTRGGVDGRPAVAVSTAAACCMAAKQHVTARMLSSLPACSPACLHSDQLHSSTPWLCARRPTSVRARTCPRNQSSAEPSPVHGGGGVRVEGGMLALAGRPPGGAPSQARATHKVDRSRFATRRGVAASARRAAYALRVSRSPAPPRVRACVSHLAPPPTPPRRPNQKRFRMTHPRVHAGLGVQHPPQRLQPRRLAQHRVYSIVGDAELLVIAHVADGGQRRGRRGRAGHRRCLPARLHRQKGRVAGGRSRRGHRVTLGDAAALPLRAPALHLGTIDARTDVLPRRHDRGQHAGGAQAAQRRERPPPAVRRCGGHCRCRCHSGPLGRVAHVRRAMATRQPKRGLRAHRPQARRPCRRGAHVGATRRGRRRGGGRRKRASGAWLIVRSTPRVAVL